MVISGTGSAGMEAAVANFVEPGAKFAVFANGYFCDRIAEMGRRYGAEVVRAGEALGRDRSATRRPSRSSSARSRGWWRSFTPRPPPAPSSAARPSATPRTRWARW